jgi:hypothetical protein
VVEPKTILTRIEPVNAQQPTGRSVACASTGRRNWANLGGENSESAGLKLSETDKNTAKMSGNSQLCDEGLHLLSPSRLPFRHPG